LDRIAADPRCVAGLSKSTIAGLLLRSAVVQSALTAALATDPNQVTAEPAKQDDDKFLTPDEASVVLRRSRQWIYRHSKTLPFVRRISRKSLLCSEAGMRRWLASHKA
jgi:hypothetical protein